MDAITNVIQLSPEISGDPWAKFILVKLINDKLLQGGVPTEGQFDLLERVFGSEFTSALAKKGISARIWRETISVLNIPRVIKATADLSYGLRQTILVGLSEPKLWVRELGRQFKYFASETQFKDSMAVLQKSKFYNKFAFKIND